MRLYDIIVRPVETEKAYLMREERKYVFVVHMDANKLQVKKAVEEIYDVTVERVRTMVMPGKSNRTRGRSRTTRRAPFKKAIVTVAEGQRIEALEA